MTDDNILSIVQEHYQQWTDDRDTRLHREDGWNDIMDAYHGKLPDDWPYLTHVVDPRLRTTILEKKARLTNSKLRGRLTPREGGDIIGARINNALLDFQWDNATDGGSMNYKWGEMDQDARLFGSSFALVTWKYEEDKDGKPVFNGNELKKIDPRDIGMINGDNVRNTKWVQVSEFLTMDELENENQVPGEPKYKNLSELKEALRNDAQDKKENNYVSRIKTLKGLEDRVGDDRAFPVIEIVTEYRKDRWITFSPRHNIIIRDIDNPYDHGQIPVVQLKYFPLSDDPWGESEVEAVLPLWRAIQATLCGYLDSMNAHMRPPLKILEGAVRMETIEYGPDAQWIVTQQDAVQEHTSSGDPLRYFQTTYSALVAAFNTAMGDSSQGVGGVDPFNPDKTATEIRSIQQQQNVRDQDNQNCLADALKDMMSMWMSNNRQFLFANPSMYEYIIKIVGEKDFAFLKQLGLDQEELTNETAQMIADIVMERDGDISDLQLLELTNAGSLPKFPVVTNPKERDPEKIEMKPKMRLDESGKEAELSITPDDLAGTYDYIPDVKSMSAGATQELQIARREATELLFNNQNVIQLLQAEGYRPNAKEILSEVFEESGTKDADRFFSQVQPAGDTNQAAPQVPGVPPAQPEQGLPTPIGADQPQQQMAQPPTV